MPESNFDQFHISSKNKERLNAVYNAFTKDAKNVLGYPANFLYDYSDLYRFFAFTINNVGDPFVRGRYNINTHIFEREVVSFFAELYHAPEETYWGYVTNGGTEGNIYGLYLARESFSNGVVYFSEDAHYSIKKASRILGMPNIQIKSQKNGEIDYEDLEKKIKADRKKPPIIVANIGTTIKGATDRVEKITDILHRNAVKKFYIHCDAALGGMILPFVDNAPIFDFRMPIGSISLSGHKMVGSPMPCGVVIARKRDVEKIQKLIEYIGAPDTTLSGSRNGHSVLFLWYAIQRFGYEGFKKIIASCLDMTNYALEQLKKIPWDVRAEEFSVTIVIKRPSEILAAKWQLAVEKDIAHLLIMPHISMSHIDAFIEDLKQEQKNVI